MAADVSIDSGSANPCCAELRKKYQKLKENRDALKQTFNIINQQADKIVSENSGLKKALKEEQKKCYQEREAKEKEIKIRKTLESEMHRLKEEISLLQETKYPIVEDKSIEEIQRLKLLLEGDKKKYEEEKKKATEASRLLKKERETVSELRSSLEKLKCEYDQTRDQFAKKVEEEKLKANREKSEAEDQKKLLETERRKIIKEKENAKILLPQLEEERKKNKALQTKFYSEVKILKKKLKLRKEELKLAKRVSKFEKCENSFIKQVVALLRQDSVQFSSRLNLLESFLSHHRPEGTNQLEKLSLLPPKPLNEMVKESGAHQITRQSVTRPSSGIIVSSQPEQPIGVKLQNYPLFTDPKSAGSQGKQREVSISSPVAKILENKNKANSKSKSKSKIKATDLQNQESSGVFLKKCEKIYSSRKRRRLEEKVLDLEIGNFKGHGEKSHETGIDSGANGLDDGFPSLIEFEKMVRNGGYMKLFDLDDDEMERKYRVAIENPLSPNMPKIGNKFRNGAKDNNPNLLKPKTPRIAPEPARNSNQLSTELFSENSRCDFHNNFVGSGETLVGERVDGSSTASTSKNLEGINEKEKNVRGENGKFPEYLILFSNMDEKCRARVCFLWNKIIAQEKGISEEIGSNFEAVLNSELLPEERACVISSLLACNISKRLTLDSQCNFNGDLTSNFGSLKDKINSVLSDVRAGQLLSETNLQDFIVTLVEEFLIKDQVQMYENGDLCPKSATIDQFVSGCIILALICTKSDQLDLILAISYKILLNYKTKISHCLLSLHVFYFICGEKLLCSKEENLLVTAVKWVVSQLERGEKKPFLQFSPCENCSFALEEGQRESFVSMILDELRACSVSAESDLDHTERQSELACLNIECGEICDEYKITGRFDFCYLMEIISLVELVASYMSWECAYNKIVGPLLKTLESSGSDEFSAGILVLIGQLGRYGVDKSGHDQSEVSKLRQSLLNYIEANNKWGLSVQFALIGALLNLIPFKLKEIVESDGHHSLHDKHKFDREIGYIKNWFSQLNAEQRDSSFILFNVDR